MIEMHRTEKSIVVVGWVVLLLVSLLPKIILQEILGQSVSADQQAVLGLSVVVVALLATLVWEGLRGLRPFFFVLLALVGGQWLVYNRIDRLPVLHAWLINPSFGVSMLAEQLLNGMVTMGIIATLVLMKKKRTDFFLVRGDTDAPVEPINWLGVRQGERWKKFGGTMTFYISLGTLAFLIIAGRPQLDIVKRALPFLPAVLLAAALNAITEEVTYKASFLAVLESPLGSRGAVTMTAAFFGIAHFYGIPYGVIGILLAGFMGWILSRSILETRGIFWAWFIHFWQDVWIFAFLAIGSITPGGG